MTRKITGTPLSSGPPILSMGRPNLGLRHRPEDLPRAPWAQASQFKRWDMLHGRISFARTLDASGTAALLRHLVDRNDYQDEVDVEIARDRDRRAMHSLRDTDPDAFLQRYEAQTVEERADYDHWEGIWNAVLAETAVEDTAQQAALEPVTGDIISGEPAPAGEVYAADPAAALHVGRTASAGFFSRFRLPAVLGNLLRVQQ